MKLLVLAALIAVSASSSSSDQQGDQQQWPWQQGKQYRYEVTSHTLARLHEGASSGNAFRAQIIVRVKSPGQLQAKLENPQHAQFHRQLRDNMALPSDLQYQPVDKLTKPFEISVQGGRVLGLSLPASFSLAQENMLKGLISALQVDLSAYHVQHPSHFDKDRQQGQFSKMEADVTGDCETLYAISPVAAEWRRELPQFASQEDPMEITKSKNYGHCHHRVAYHFGVPDGAEWTGTAHSNKEQQFISHSGVSRILAGKQGIIYKAETKSHVHVHAHVYGRQKAEVHSHVQLTLMALEPDSGTEWQKPEASRQIKTLLYALTTKQVAIHDESHSGSDSGSHEHIYVLENEQKRTRRSLNSEPQEWNNERQHGSSSSSDSSSAFINDDVPNMDEPAYASLYMNSQSRGDKKQNPMNVQKLLQDLAQQLQNPNNMPKSDFLSKFNILVRIIASMSKEQLAQTSRSIEVGRSSTNAVKADMWMVYRDAVVQAGTPPAFQQIKTWIMSKKIENEEAAQVISTLARTLRYPLKDIMIQFFNLAMSPEVQQQDFLGNSALLAATKFINLGQVNNRTAHSFYPTHMYGRLARRQDNFVLENILPRLTEELRKAIQENRRNKAQVYIKAIGNLGHREILQTFAPYLEGQTPVSTHLRTQMVMELRPLAEQQDKYVRAVLYNILKNTAEPYEVRVAAILNIFVAHPHMDMMQVMAEMTNSDPSIQVRTALKNGIETAAELKNPRYRHLAKSAQAVREIVTRENLGVRASTLYFADEYENQEEESSYFRETSYVGSGNSFMPKYLRQSWRSKINGWVNENSFSFSYSDFQKVYDYLKQLIYEPRQSEASFKHTAQQIAEMLNIKRDSENPLEASLYFDIFNQERFFSFDENDLQRLAKDIGEYMKQVEKGVNKHYTKVLNTNQISVMFPIASGVPFIYKYKEPIVLHIQSKAKGKIERNPNSKGLSGQMDKEVQLVFASNIDGSVGFIDTFSDQLASAGVIKKFQVNVPFKMTMQMKSGEAKIRFAPLRPEQDTTIVHYSVWPYTANQKKDSLVAIAQDPTTKLVERPRKISSTDVKFGQETGNVFQVQGYSYSSDFRSASNVLQALYNVKDLLEPKDLALTHYNIRYLGKQSQNKAVTLTVAYDELHNQKQSGELGQPQDQQDTSPNSGVRREQLAKRVTSGINIAHARVVDLSATFEGPQKQEYVLTAAVGESPIDTKVQVALFAGRNSAQRGNEQINAVAKVTKPQYAPLNFLDALKKDMKMTYDVNIKYGQNGNIRIEGNTDRSPKYTELLRTHPLAMQCEKDIANNNQYQFACHKMVVKAQAPDQFKASVTYNNVSPMFTNWTLQAYRMFKQLSCWNVEENPMEKTEQGKLQFNVDASYIDSRLRFQMASPRGVVRIDNVPIPKITPYAVSMYSLFNIYDRMINYKTNYQHQPFCTIDGTRVKTFANRSYEYQLSPSWHVVMLDESNNYGKWEDLVILARRPSENQQEIYISYKTAETGKNLEIEIQSSGSKQHTVKVQSNGKKISEGELTLYWDEMAEAPLLRYYTQADGVLLLNIRDGRLRLMFDGQRFVLFTQDHRRTTNGICGRHTGEPRKDYQTPNGLVDQPQHYGASFSLDENSDPKTQQLKNEAKQKAYQSQPKYTLILRSDEQWQQAVQKREENWGSQNVYRAKSYLKLRGQCQLQQQVQYHQNHGEICITTTPLPSCQSHCQGEGYRVQAAQVICKSSSDQQFQTYRNQIQRGENPEVSGVPKVEQYRVPTSCRA